MHPHALRPSAEMNIIALIDVLLVLLVIFLAALPITDGMRRAAGIRQLLLSRFMAIRPTAWLKNARAASALARRSSRRPAVINPGTLIST